MLLLMIPKVIHRMWLDRYETYNTSAPKKYDRSIATFNEHNPEFEVQFWNMARVKNLFESYPEIAHYQETWTSFPHHIQKCDFARYIILYLFGGVYIDLDFTCFKNISPLLDRELLLVLEPTEHAEAESTGPKLFNGVMGSVSRHPFWLDWLDFIVESVKTSNDVMLTTGPTNFGIFFTQSEYKNTPLIDTCDILPLFYCYEKPHCIAKQCAKRLDPSYHKIEYYHHQLGNYMHTKWVEGSGWGVETLADDKIEKFEQSNTTTNTSSNYFTIIAIIILIVLFMTLAVTIVALIRSFKK
jgi:inositol phosphorylceramide mannosyltransferase catalytic subunit